MSEAGNGLRLYNTLTRTKEAFAPIDPKNVRMYVCGPTVYDFAHIGNARPVIVFDVLFRLLRHLYGAEHVNYVRNITDVDDKINARAARDYPNLPLNEAIRIVTEETNAQFQADVAALGCLPPTSQPRATEHIDEMRALIERLVKNGVAYVAEDHVLFSPSAMNARKTGPRYGALSRRALDDMLAGARVDVAAYKRDEMDFVLWKPSKPGEPGWPAPAGISGLGRPGWHIECSAMSMAKLLEPYGGGLRCDDPEKNVFDIHAGGIDLVFPHHENEIAQSCCAFGSERMANIWMHNGFLQVEGRKMAKSEGNFVTINELLHQLDGNGLLIRYNMLRAHYRQPIDWTDDGLAQSSNELNELWLIASDFVPTTVDDNFIEALSDDLNTPLARARLFDLLAVAKKGNVEAGGRLRASLELYGFGGLFVDDFSMPAPLPDEPAEQLAAIINHQSGSLRIGEIGGRIRQEIKARQLQRNALSQEFWSLLNQISPDMPIRNVNHLDGLNYSSIASHIYTRLAFIREKNWADADRIRDELLAQGVQLKDGKDPATGERVTTWEVKR